MLSFFFFKQKTAYEMRISDWSSDVCSSDLLVVAPHVRLFAEASDAERAAVAKLAVPGKVMIDLASDRLFDMSYTSGADIYLGDVSSQVYEFLATHRPVLFLDAHVVDWEGDPDYLFGALADVVSDIAKSHPAPQHTP